MLLASCFTCTSSGSSTGDKVLLGIFLPILMLIFGVLALLALRSKAGGLAKKKRKDLEKGQQELYQPTKGHHHIGVGTEPFQKRVGLANLPTQSKVV
ncbi:hypothetical protein WICPIJ_003478 [Wickerhamomyces pijperi]|uniref:Uncharacterized protein n=1 Tax=Wickerhamomyces pijperi TaxID=599730 RepID=A0A9P8Q7R5_WICPI|nr:hypothetical protein WICPIJ_003478 [Wickerhamomyces pijperi]